MLEFDRQLGERIRQIRRTITNTTQEEFGEEIGVSRQTMNAYENDHHKPTMETLEEICTRYHISSVWLLTGNGSMQDGRHTLSEGDEKESTAEQQTLINFINAKAERATRLTQILMHGGVENL